MEPNNLNRELLDRLYAKYNKRRYVHPDPLEFLYNYDDLKDREIAGLIASGLAYGRVQQILKSVSTVLNIMDSPFEFVRSVTPVQMKKFFRTFKHRFTTGDELVDLLSGIKNTLDKYGSLEHCFIEGYSDYDESVYNALLGFTAKVLGDPNKRNSLLPCPAKYSAFKRINLYLRWMVRKDDVDPGGWDAIPPSKLIIPLDTHMHKIGLQCNATKRKQNNIRTALDITDAFKRINPEDPVKYDFVLTRFGIWEHNKDTNDGIS